MKNRLIIILLTVVFGCSSPVDQLKGSWDDKKGQLLNFYDQGRAEWIYYTYGEKETADTFKLKYEVNFEKKPFHLKLSGFDRGPLKGKSLFGIIEINQKTLKIDSQGGSSENVRPKSFDSENTELYYKK